VPELFDAAKPLGAGARSAFTKAAKEYLAFLAA